jgi:hypothetical protein
MEEDRYIPKPKPPKGRLDQWCWQDVHLGMFFSNKRFIEKFCSKCEKRESETWVCMLYNLKQKGKNCEKSNQGSI